MSSTPNPYSAPEEIKFCPKCGSKLETDVVQDKPRRVCPSCSYICFTDPKVGVGVLVINKGKVLLVKRAMKPERGKWSIPAGFLDYGEDPELIAVKEVFEETNLIVSITGLVDVYYNPEALSAGGASIFILYQAELHGGEIKAGDDAEEAAFFEQSRMPELAFPSTKDAVAKWVKTGDQLFKERIQSK